LSSEVKIKCPKCDSENITLTKTWDIIPKSKRGAGIRILLYRCNNCGSKLRKGEPLVKVAENPQKAREWVINKIYYSGGVLYSIDLSFTKPARKTEYCVMCKEYNKYVSIFRDCLRICESMPEDKEMLTKISEKMAVYRCKWLREINFSDTLFKSFKCPFREFTDILILVDKVVVGVVNA